MYQYDHPTASPTLPAAGPAGTPGYFNNGDPVAGTPRSVLEQDFMNTLMLELLNVLSAASITPAKGTNDQVAEAIQALIASATDGSFGFLASAATTDLGTVSTQHVRVTGTSTITSFGSSATSIKPVYLVEFNDALQLVNSSDLLLPAQQDLSTTAGDSLLARYRGGGTWQVIAFFDSNLRQPVFVPGTNGYRIDANGCIEQWGLASAHSQSGGTYTVTFPIAFPNACMNVVMTALNSTGNPNSTDTFPQVVSLGPSSFTALMQSANDPSNSTSLSAYWRAIGY